MVCPRFFSAVAMQIVTGCYWPAVALGVFSLAVMRVDDRLLERWQAAPDPELPAMA